MNKKHYSVEILADSINEQLNRLTTFKLTYPRFVHAEFMTHRMLSRNAASSRAIPTITLLRQVADDPVMPLRWGKNCKGMSAKEDLDALDQVAAEEIWWEAAADAMYHARRLHDIGVHKQVANRGLETYLPITVIATATEWDNFLYLRDTHLAQPEIAWVAREIRRELEISIPTIAGPGEWHCPLVNDDEPEDPLYCTEDPREISAARCARVSYLTHEGVRDESKDLALFSKLVEAGHWSPLEHVAMCMASDSRWGNFFGWKQFRKHYENENAGRDLE